MKILLLHQHFKIPQRGGAVRSFYLAQALISAQHRVVVITSHNEPSDKVEMLEGIEIHHLSIAYDNRFGFYARAWSFLLYIIRASLLARKYKDFDVCYAISVPLTVGLAARWIKFWCGMKYIFEVGDLWPDAPIQMGFIRNSIFQRWLFFMERSIYRSADSIVALSPAIKAAIEMKVPGKLIHLIPNMADCEFFRQQEKRQDLEKKFQVSGKFVVSYIGALGIANGLDFYLECARSAQKANLPLHFLLCGEGAMRESLQERTRQLDLQNLSFVDFLNRNGVKEVMIVTDAVFICYKPIPILETGSPNKFFDGLAAGKLIITNFGGWIRHEIEENRCGVFVDPQKPGDFVNKLAPFISNQLQLREFQIASRALAERKYSRKLLSKEFVGLFKE